MLEQIKAKAKIVIENTRRGLESGKKVAADEWAEHFQDGGNRKQYNFANPYWDDSTALLKYPIYTESQSFVFNTSKIRNIKAPVVLSGSVYDESLELTFPVSIDRVFFGARELETIEELQIVNEDYNTDYFNVFAHCNSLKNINKIVGSINGDGLDFTQTQITPESMKRIIDSLGYGNFDNTISFSYEQWDSLERAFPYTEFYPDSIFLGIYSWKDHIYGTKGFNY